MSRFSLFIGIPIAAFFAWLLGGAVAPKANPQPQDTTQLNPKIELHTPAPEVNEEDEVRSPTLMILWHWGL